MVTDAEKRQRFGFAVRVAMANRGWSPADLAREMGVNKSTTGRWASGDGVPDLLQLGPLSEKLGVDPRYLYEPDPIPSYPISLEGLVRKATAEGQEEGLAEKPKRRRRRATPPADGEGSAE